MSYLVLARKSSPQTFAQVVGQKAVVRTLQNGLMQNRVPHALIFSGVRGTGKTTLARIMAKALNCEKNEPPEPCNECVSCKEIMAGSSVDLHEIDGASNRGIGEIRELKENIRFMPTSSRYKIIIIDEVHMLTTEAFNALLKTLEEPPEHVYFMFATTELHKVPVTILSRCQRYELKRVSHTELFDHFGSLAKQEGITIDDAALNMVVREAGGSVRDGLSLLDQIFSYCGDNVTGEEVVDVLGLVSHQVIADLAKALLTADLATALTQLDAVYSYGMDIKRFINELLSWFRGLVVCSVSKQPAQLLDLPADELAVLQKIADTHSHQSLLLMFHLLMDGLEKAAYSTRPRFAVEMVFIKAVQAQDIVPVTELLGRLDKALDGVALPLVADQPAHPQPKPVAPVEVASSAPGKEPVHEPVKQSAPAVVTKEAIPAPPVQPVKPETTPEPEKQPEPIPPPQDKDIPISPKPDLSEPVVAAPQQEVAEHKTQKQTGEKHQPRNEAERKTGKPAVLTKDIRKDWPRFIEYVRDRHKWMAGTLQLSSSVRIEAGELIIHFNNPADCRIFSDQDKLRPLTEFASDFFQESLRVRFKLPDASGCDGDPNSGAAVQKERQALENHPLVITATEVFNGQVGDIRVGPRFRKPLSVDDGIKETNNKESK